MVTEDMFTVEQSIFSLQFTVTLLFIVIPIEPFSGAVLFTTGAVLSMVIVFPAEGVSALLPVSVARLCIV